MPPRSAKKTVVKKPSAKVTKPSLQTPPAVVEKKKTDPEPDPLPAIAASPAKTEVAESQDSAAESLKDAGIPLGENMDTEEGVDGAGDEEVTGGDNNGSDNDEEENNENDEDDPSLYSQPSLTENKKQREFEIFVGRLDKEVVEDDLIKVFGVFGEVQSVRIVKHPSTHKRKVFGFVQYASMEHAKKALAELKDGVEVKGKRATVSVSEDKDTLYLGNICKTWTKDNVMDTLKGLGVDQIEQLVLPEDQKNEGRIRGFAYLEFGSHSDATAALQRLKKPDAVFGCDISARVAFTNSLHPKDETLLEVKEVYLEGIPESWDEVKVKEVCNQYGEIENVRLSRNFTRTKKKDYGFVKFSSHDSAVACVEGINNTQLGEGDVKVKASLAKLQNKGRHAKQITRGGFQVKTDGKVTEDTVENTSIEVKEVYVEGIPESWDEDKVKEVCDQYGEIEQVRLSRNFARTKKKDYGFVEFTSHKSAIACVEGINSAQLGEGEMEVKASLAKPQNKGRHARQVAEEAVQSKSKKDAKSKEVPNMGKGKRGSQATQSSNGKRRGGRGVDTVTNERASKRARRPSNTFGDRSTYSGMPRVNYIVHPATYASSYALPATSYQAQAYAGVSGSSRRHSDMEPHAGYIPAARGVHNSYGNDQRRAAAYVSQPPAGSSRYARALAAAPVVQPSYPEYPSHSGYQAAGYAYPSSGQAYDPRRGYY